MLGGCFASKHGQNSSNVSAPCKESPRIPRATQTGDWQSRDYQSPSAILQMLIGGLATKELLIIDSLIKEPPRATHWGMGTGNHGFANPPPQICQLGIGKQSSILHVILIYLLNNLATWAEHTSILFNNWEYHVMRHGIGD